MLSKFFISASLALVAAPALAADVSPAAIANFTLVDGAISPGAAGSLVVLPPEDVANDKDVSLYVMTLENQDGLSGAQITYKGDIIVQLLPTNDAIENTVDYTGITVYDDSNPSPASGVEQVDIGGVTVEQYKAPGYSFVGSATKSSSFNPSTFLGAFAGKTQADFDAALAAGDLEVVVRSYAYPDGEMTGTLKAVDVPPAATAAVTAPTEKPSSATVASALSLVAAGLMVL